MAAVWTRWTKRQWRRVRDRHLQLTLPNDATPTASSSQTTVGTALLPLPVADLSSARRRMVLAAAVAAGWVPACTWLVTPLQQRLSVVGLWHRSLISPWLTGWRDSLRQNGHDGWGAAGKCRLYLAVVVAAAVVARVGEVAGVEVGVGKEQQLMGVAEKGEVVAGGAARMGEVVADGVVGKGEAVAGRAVVEVAVAG